jgi:hypothetical protein
MTLQEYKERCIAEFTKRQRITGEAITGSVLPTESYAKRVGIFRTWGDAATILDEVLKSGAAREPEPDDDDEGVL